MQLIEQQAAARLVGLKPLAIDDELRNGPLAHVAQKLGRCDGIGVYIDFGVRDAMRIEEQLSRAAIAAPGSRIHLHHHVFILLPWR